MFLRFIVLVTILQSGSLCAGSLSTSPEAGDLAKGKQIYAQKMQEITQALDASESDLLASYGTVLGAFRQAAQQKGDFEGVREADTEIQRFEKQKTLPPAAPVLVSADLAKAGVLSRKALEKVELDDARKIVELTQHYLKFLDCQKIQAVKEDKMALAKSCDDESKAVRDAPEYQGAAFLVADSAPLEPVREPERTPAVSDAASTPMTVASNAARAVLSPVHIGSDGKKSVSHLDPGSLYDAQRIYEATTAVQGVPSFLKPLPSMETGKAPIAGGVGIALDGHLDIENAQYQLRFKLRTKLSSASFENLKVLVQYFFRNPNGGITQEDGLQFVLIPELNAKCVICEMQPVELPAIYTKHHKKDKVEDRDDAFLGAVVSVFSPDEKLLAQVISVPLLKDRAKTVFELPDRWVRPTAEAAEKWWYRRHHPHAADMK